MVLLHPVNGAPGASSLSRIAFLGSFIQVDEFHGSPSSSYGCFIYLSC